MPRRGWRGRHLSGGGSKTTIQLMADSAVPTVPARCPTGPRVLPSHLDHFGGEGLGTHPAGGHRSRPATGVLRADHLPKTKATTTSPRSKGVFNVCGPWFGQDLRFCVQCLTAKDRHAQEQVLQIVDSERSQLVLQLLSRQQGQIS